MMSADNKTGESQGHKQQQQAEEKSGRGEMPPKNGEIKSLSGFFKKKIDFEKPPAFNIQGESINALGVSDLDGIAVRLFVELSHAGHAYFDKESWGKLLDLLNFQDFLSGEASKKVKEFKETCLSYRRLENEVQPWALEYSKRIHKHWVENKDALSKLIQEAVEKAKVMRGNMPPRTLIFYGDIISDRDASAGDMAILFSLYVLIIVLSLPIKIIAANHDIMGEQLFQFLSARYGEGEEKEKHSWFVRHFKRRVIREADEKEKGALLERFRCLFDKSYDKKTQKVMFGNIIKEFKMRPGTYSANSLKKMLNYLTEIPPGYLVNIGKEGLTGKEELLLQEILSVIPIGSSVMTKVTSKQFDLLQRESSKISSFIWGAIDPNGNMSPELKNMILAEKQDNGEFPKNVKLFIAQEVLANDDYPAEFKELFSETLFVYKHDIRVSGKLNFKVCGEARKALDVSDLANSPDKCDLVRKELDDLLQEDYKEDIVEDKDGRKKIGKVERPLVRLSEEKVSFSEGLREYLKDAVSSFAKHFGVDLSVIDNGDDFQLLSYYKWLILKSMTSKNERLFRAKIVNNLIVENSESLKWLPVDDAFIKELVSLRRLGEVLSDVRNALDEASNAVASRLFQSTVYPTSFWASSASVLMYLSPGATPDELDLNLGDGTITLLGEVLYKKAKPPEMSASEYRGFMNQKYQELRNTADCRLLDDKGSPTEHVRRRLLELQKWFSAFKGSTCLVYRSGINGDFITHAPLVGFKGETSDQSMLLHYLLPMASIMLEALEKNKDEGKSSVVRQEASALCKSLDHARSLLPMKKEDILNLPGFHVKLWGLMDAINDSYRFFFRHSLIVATASASIPKTHIGLLSRSPKAEVYESMIIDAGNDDPRMRPNDPVVDIDMRRGFGASSEKEPLIALIYPFAGFTWSRATEKPERMRYVRPDTEEVICELAPISQQSYGHMSVPGGPFGKCIDSVFQPAKAVIVKHYSSPEPRPDWVSNYIAGARPARSPTRESRLSLVSSLRGGDDDVLGPNYRDEGSFFPLLLKGIVKAMAEEARGFKGGLVVTEGVELTDVDDSALEQGLIIRTKNLNALRRRCIAKIKKRFEGKGDQRISIREVLYEFLKGIADHPDLRGDVLAKRASLALNYIDSSDHLTERAIDAFSVVHASRVKGYERAAILMENWLLFCALDKNLISMMRLELAAFAIPPSQYSQELCEDHSVGHFFDGPVKSLVEVDVKDKKEGPVERSKTTVSEMIVAILGLIPSSAFMLSGMFTMVAAFVDSETTKDIGRVFVNVYTLLSLSVVSLTCSLVVENRHQMPDWAQPRLRFLSKFFPRLSGLAKQWFFSFPMRPFLYIELVNVMFERLKLLAWNEVSLCSNTTGFNTSVGLEGTSTNSTSLSSGTTESSSVVPEEYLVLVPAWSFGLLLSFFTIALGCLSPKTSMFPGYQPPRGVIARFEEGAHSIVVRGALSGWSGFGWLESVCIAGVGANLVLSMTGATCSNYMAAVVSTLFMAVPLSLRLIAYPPSFRVCRDKGNTNSGRSSKAIKVYETKSCVQKSSLLFNLVFASPLHFYLLGLYGAYLVHNYVDDSFEVYSVLSDVSESIYKQVIIGVSFLGVVLMGVDLILSFRGTFSRTDDLDVAASVRKEGKKEAFQIRQRERALTERASGTRGTLLREIRQHHQVKTKKLESQP